MKTEGYPRSFTVAAVLIALAAAAYVAVHIYQPLIVPILDVAPPFAIAMAFAFLLDPVVDWFQRHGFSRAFGVTIVGLSFLIVFLLVGFMLVPQLAEQAVKLSENISTYSDQAQEQIGALLVKHKALLERFHLPTTMGEWTQRFSKQSERWASLGVSVVANALTFAVGKILWIVIIPLSTLWLLRDLDYMKAKVVHFTPDRHKDRLMRVSSAVGGVFGKYVRGMFAVAMMHSLVASAVLTLAGLDYALIIGGLSGLLYMVPYVGVMITMIATGVAALVQPAHSFGYAGALMAAMAFQSFIFFDMVVTPRVVGGSVGVHPVLSLFCLALGARLFGVVGMVAAVPFAAALQVALSQWYPQINDKLVTPFPKVGKAADDQPEEST